MKADFLRVGRQGLLDEIDRLEKLNILLNNNATTVQQRCTELIIEVRAYRASGICLPGWLCHACHAFNGSAKETLSKCRCCDTPRNG
jgi:hypothetical protein